MPDSGEIILDGEKLSPKHVQYIGYLPEERGLYKTMKVGEQCLYLAQMKGLSKAEAKKQLEYWFERLGIQGWWNKKIQELSKGMAQKIQFVVTVLHKPKLLILDEPSNHLDMKTKDIIKDALRDFDGTLILVSHDRDFLDGLATKVFEFGNKRVVEHFEDITGFLANKKMENIGDKCNKQSNVPYLPH